MARHHHRFRSPPYAKLCKGSRGGRHISFESYKLSADLSARLWRQGPLAPAGRLCLPYAVETDGPGPGLWTRRLMPGRLRPKVCGPGARTLGDPSSV